MPVLDLAATEGRDGVPQAKGGAIHLRLRGPLTASTAGRARQAIVARASGGERPVVVDLEAVTAVDASGIAALLEGQRALDAASSDRMFLRTSPMVTWALKRSATIGAFRLWTAPLPAGAAVVDVE